MLGETSESVASHLVGKLREATKNKKGTLVMGPSPIVTYSIKCFLADFPYITIIVVNVRIYLFRFGPD